MSLLTRLLCACALAAPALAADPLQGIAELPLRIEQRQPHDASLFTQGIGFHGELIVESGGGYRESRLLVRTVASSQAMRTVALPKQWFAEGIAVHGDRVFVLTWREGVAQSFLLPQLQPAQRFRYDGEGWGLTSDGTRLIQSDGSDVLTWRNPEDFSVVGKIAVRAGDEPVQRLNELEWVQGWIVANVWLSDYVIGIEPESGCVRWKLSLAGLLQADEKRKAEVLNGVAWDPRRELLWVTGKRWPWLFGLRVELPPLARGPALTGGACPG